MLNDLNQLQIARQSVFNTAIATPTSKLSNVSSFKLNPELEARLLSQIRGTLAPGYQTVLDEYKSSATFEVEGETYEDINYWFDSLFSAATPSGTGPYTRDYAAPLTSEATPKFLTAQWGQTGKVWRAQDLSVATMQITGESNGSLGVGGSCIGGLVTTGALAALSDRTAQTLISGCVGSLYIDAWAGTIGTTAIANSFFAYELSINSNREYRGYIGQCSPTAWKDGKWTGQLRLSVELNDTTDDLLNAIFASPNTILQRQIRIKHTTGTGATERTLQIDFAGHCLQAPELFTDRNGVAAFDLVLDGVYNPTLANWLKIQTKSETATLV